MSLVPMDPRDAMARAMWEDHRDFMETEDALWSGEWDKVRSENAAMRELLKQSYRQHDWVDEDCWYSCPKADDYCGDMPRDKCLCGADDWNARVDAVLNGPH